MSDDRFASMYDAARDWVRAFEAEHGRAPRILHVGNVAGNAYLNAKFLREIGVECHVLSHDYYHPIGTPEWEDGIVRPEWFVQGPLPLCAEYLEALLEGRNDDVLRLRRRLDRIAAAAGHVPPKRLASMRTALRKATIAVNRASFNLRHWRSYAWNWYLRVFGLRVTSLLRRMRVLPPRRPCDIDRLEEPDPRSLEREAIIAEFDDAFPQRPDRLSDAEVEQYQYHLDHWKRLLDRYDVVQGYGTDVVRPYVARRRPFVGYEHGTLRDFTMGDDPVHRLTALAYRQADHVFVTNGDCLAYARRLGVTQLTPMIHPVDVARYRRDLGDRPRAIRSEIGAEVILLCPLRHDWSVKGTDVHLRALPLIVQRLGASVALVLCDWGAQVAESKALLDELGCRANARWLPALNRDDFVAHLQACDVVLDQVALPHFGATAPQAIAAGVPVISSYEPESTEWIVSSPAPIIPARTPEEVAEAVQTAVEPGWRPEYRACAEQWTREHHHPTRIVAEHCRVYRQLLEGGS